MLHLDGMRTHAFGGEKEHKLLFLAQHKQQLFTGSLVSLKTNFKLKILSPENTKAHSFVYFRVRVL